MTSSIRTGTRSALAVALLAAGAMACSGKSSSAPLANDLLGDLEAAKSSSVELANSGARRTQVVSAEELTGRAPARAPERAPQAAPRTAAPRKVTPSRAPASTPTPVASSTPSVDVTPEPEAPAASPDPLPPIEPRPAPSRPAPTPSRHGGYKSVGDVIRDAPFPINP